MNLSKIFAEDKLLLDKIIWAIELLGSWPLNRTIKQTTIFISFVVYYTIHMSMSYTDLINVFGNLELMTINLMETVVQTMITIRLVYLKLSPSVKKTIVTIKEHLSTQSYNDLTEENIYNHYGSIAKLYYSLTMTFTGMTSIGWYCRSLQEFITARLQNQPAPLSPPYKVIYVYLNLTSIQQVLLVYIYQIPMLLPPSCYTAVICLKLVIITNICSQMAVLSHRIKNLKSNKNTNGCNIFGDIVRKHLELVRLTKELDDSWTLIFCFELVVSTLLCALVLYNALLVASAGNKIMVITLGTYVCSSLLFLFSNCLMGELLKFESENLQEALYSCNWYEMRDTEKRALLICMVRAQIPLQLTAGKFYIYSFTSYTGIVKSAMAYVSLLRTLTL